MACKYYINDEWVGEKKLKQLLYDGLLDQLVGTKNFKVDGFKPNQKYIKSTYTGSTIEPVRLKVKRKINQPSLINTERKLKKAKDGEYLGKATFEMPRKNPIAVLKEANEKIKKANKGKSTKAKGNKFILVTKIKGKLELGKKIDSELTEDIAPNILKSMKEGAMYMLVQSADGLMPVWLRSAFIGETKDAPKIKSALKTLFNNKASEAQKKKAAVFIHKRLYRFKISFSEDGVTFNRSNEDGGSTENFFETLEKAELFILGSYDDNGNYTGEFNDNGKKTQTGQLARVNHYDINSPSTDKSPFSNEYYANNGYISTDIFSDSSGNFYHSSSFVLDTYQAEGNTIQEVDKMINDPESNQLKEDVEESVAKDAVTPKVTNQKTKENENEAFIKKVEEEQLKKQEESEKSTDDKADEAAARLFASSQEIAEDPTKTDAIDDAIEDSFEGNIFDANAGEAIDDGSDVPKAKLDKPANEQNLIDLGKELKEVKRIVGEQTVKAYGFNSVEDLKKYLPNDIYERLLRARKHGKVVHGLYTEAAVYLSENAMEGTGYHEAFHVVFNLSLSLGQRMRLIYEAQEKFKEELSENPPFIETEELLADKFMEYVQSKGTPDKSLGKRISDYFKSLWRELQLFFSPNSKLSIDKVFEDMDLGIYRNKKNYFTNTDLKKIDPSMVRFKMEKRFEDINIETEGIQYLQYKVFRLLEDYTRKNPEVSNLSDPEIIAKIGINNFYSSLVQQLGNDIAAVDRDTAIALQKGNEARAEMLREVSKLRKDLMESMTNTTFEDIILLGKNKISSEYLKITPLEKGVRFTILKPTEFLQKFTRSLRQYGIKISLDKVNLDNQQNVEDTSLEEGIEVGKEYVERWQKAHIEFNPYDTVSQQVKRKLATITKMVPQKEGADKFLRNSFGSPIYYSSRDIYNYLGKQITDSYSPSDMVNRIEKLQNDKPYMQEIFSMVIVDNAFKNQLYTTLASKTFQKFTLVYEKDGQYRVMASNRTGFDKIITQNIVGEFLTEDSKFFNKHTEGLLKGQTNFEDVNSKEVRKTIENLKTVKRNYIYLREKGEILEALEEISKLLRDANINLSTQQLELIWNPPRNTKKSSFSNITKMLNSTIYLFEDLEAGENPFLSMIPKKFLSEKNKEYNSAPLAEFTKSIMNAFEDDLVAAFRNADGKTVYSIQLSNYLNKKLSKFKNEESLQQYKEKVKDDPILSKLPLIESLIDEHYGGLTDIARNLEVTVLDALARKGKNQSVSYTDLSDPEMVATELALFHNSGNRTYARFKFPISSDAPTLPIIKHTRKSRKEVVDDITTIAMAEKERIIKFKNLPKDAELRRIANYKENATKFNILSFLNDKITNPETVTEEQMKGYVEDYLNNEFLELQKKKYKEAGAIKSFEKGPNGKIIFAEKIITSERQSNSKEFFIDFLYNQYLMNMQLSTIFAGDPAFYKGTVDYQKRFKEIISPGTFTNHERIMPEYRGYIFSDEYVPTQQETAKEIINNIKKSNLPEQKKLELTALWEQLSNQDPKAKTNNITDAATFISVERMVDIYDSLNRLTPELEQAAERIKQGIEKPEDAGMFQIFKPFQFTKRMVNGVEVPVQVKNSEMLLTKSYASRSPKLMKMYELLNDSENGVDFIAFDSAVKVGRTEERGTEKSTKKHSQLLETSEGNYELSPEAEVISLLHEDWRLQQETPNHFIDDIGNYGSQLRVLAIADLNPEGTYIVGDRKYTAKKIASEYQNLVVENIKESFEEVQDMFLDSEGNLDIEVLTNHLKQEITDRDLGEEYFEAIELVEDTLTKKKKTALPLWHPMLTYKVESLMNSFFKNRVTRQKINGGQLVNATSYGVSDSLHYDAKTNTFDVLLPQWTAKFFPKNEDGSPKLENIPEELLHSIAYRIPTEDKYSIFNLRVKGFTDAAAGGHIILPREATTLAGLDFDIDKMFIMIPNHRVNKEGNPVYIKYYGEESNVSSEELAYNLTRSNRKLRQFLNEYLTEEDALEFEEEIKQARKNIREAYEQRSSYFEGDTQIKDIYLRHKELSLQLEHETNLSVRKASEQKLEDLEYDLSQYSKIKDYHNFEKEAYGNLRLELKNLIDELKESKEIDYSFFNSKESRDNRIIEILGGIMSNKNTALSSVDPGNFDKLIELGMRMRILKIDSDSENNKIKEIKNKGLEIIKKFDSGELKLFDYREQLKKLMEEYEEQDFNINLPSTQLELFRRNMTGKELIGPMANHNTSHAKSQFTNLQLASPVTFDGVDFKYLNLINSPFDGGRISKSLATKLAAVVDNAKDPVASYLNLNMYTANIIAMLSRLGVQEDTIFAYLNQPIIEELTKKYFNERGAVGDDAQRLFEIKKEWTTKLAMKLKTSSSKVEEKLAKQDKSKNLTKEELEDAIANRNTMQYYETQLKVLNLFEEHFSDAKELSKIVQATRIDTKGVGPTNGANYEMLSRQDKVLNKKNPRILNASELLYDSGGDLKINPAFQKYSWLGAINVMNKVFPSIGKSDGRRIEWSGLGKIKNYFASMKKEGMSLNEQEARSIDIGFMTALTSKLPMFKYMDEGQNQATKVITQTPRKLREFKNQNPDSKYAKFLNQLTINKPDSRAPYTTIRFYNTGRTPLDMENYRRLWEAMLEDPNDQIKDLAFELVKYTYFTGGFNFGPFTFYNLVPVKFWTDKFARKPENAKRGLLTSDGKSHQQILENELFKDRNEIFKDNIVTRFLVQYMKNTAQKSAIIPYTSVTDIETNIAPEGLPQGQLAEDEVFVMGTSNEGAHNAGLSRYSYSLNNSSSFNPNVDIKGRQGKYIKYGSTNQVSKGKLGKGFGLQLYPEFFTENGTKLLDSKLELQKLERNNTEEYQKLREKQKAYLKNSLNQLINAAKSNPDLSFRVSDLTGPFNFKVKEIRDILYKLQKAYGDIPGNIALLKKYEIRGYGKIKVQEDGRLVIPTRTNQHLKRNEEFPAFMKVKVGKEIKLYRRLGDSKVLTNEGDSIEPKVIQYNEIGTLGVNNFLVEYNLDGNIEQSALEEILRHEKTNNTNEVLVPELSEPDLGITDDNLKAIDALMSEQIEGTTSKPSEFKTKKKPKGLPSDFMFDESISEEEKARLTEADFSDIEKATDGAVEETLSKENRKTTDVTYNNYARLFQKAVQENREDQNNYIKLEDWNTYPIEIRRSIIECL